MQWKINYRLMIAAKFIVQTFIFLYPANEYKHSHVAIGLEGDLEQSSTNVKFSTVCRETAANGLVRHTRTQRSCLQWAGLSCAAPASPSPGWGRPPRSHSRSAGSGEGFVGTLRTRTLPEALVGLLLFPQKPWTFCLEYISGKLKGTWNSFPPAFRFCCWGELPMSGAW